MYFDVHKAKVYKEIYRPSVHLSRLFRSLMVVIMSGQSPMGKPSYQHNRKSK